MFRRNKILVFFKCTRRISYLKATSGNGMAVDSSEYELSDLETTSTATVPVDPVPSAVAPVNRYNNILISRFRVVS